jgi:hypothetical protein
MNKNLESRALQLNYNRTYRNTIVRLNAKGLFRIGAGVA